MILTNCHRVAILFFGLLVAARFSFALTSAPSSSTFADSLKQSSITVLIVYYSHTGNTEKLAHAVAEGAQTVPFVTVLTKTPEEVTEADLKNADALLLGSPTYFGNMAAQMKAFIDDWWFKYRVPLVDKVGGAFSSGGDETGGKEHVIHSFIIAMMNAGMIIVGPLEESYGLPGVSALDPVTEKALKEARALGERAANLARRVRTGSR